MLYVRKLTENYGCNLILVFFSIFRDKIYGNIRILSLCAWKYGILFGWKFKYSGRQTDCVYNLFQIKNHPSVYKTFGQKERRSLDCSIRLPFIIAVGLSIWLPLLYFRNSAYPSMFFSALILAILLNCFTICLVALQKKKAWIWNPKTRYSGIITCIPQTGLCPYMCEDCFFQNGRSYLEPLAVNLPHIPPRKLTKNRVVRINDGNDSSVDRKKVERVARRFDNFFFNTRNPDGLQDYPGPVVFTANGGAMTDKNFYKLDRIPRNLMFVRIRTNAWNRDVLREAVRYYTSRNVPIVITYKAYYTKQIADEFFYHYIWEKRVKNSYFVLSQTARREIEAEFRDNPFVYTCMYKNSHYCIRCGNCMREFWNTMERLRDPSLRRQ